MYLKVTHDSPENIGKYTNQTFHVLFLDALSYKAFNLEYYNKWQTKVPNFLYVAVADQRDESIIDVYKALADQVVYLDQSEEMLEWNSFSILRRFWNVSSKDSVIIYREVIADFVEHSIHVNQEKVELSQKEYDVFKYLLQHRGQFVAKNLIYEKIWKNGLKDVSRSVDQVVHRLKQKIGPKYFTNSRSTGLRFE